MKRTVACGGAIASMVALVACKSTEHDFGHDATGGRPNHDASASGGATGGNPGSGGATGGNPGSGGATGGSSGSASGGLDPGSGGADSGGSSTGGSPEDAGCQVDLGSVTSCGTSCSQQEECKEAHTTDVACTGGKCVLTCAPGFANCDGKGFNGCEVNLNSPVSCGTSCETLVPCQPTAPVCSAGACGPIPSCEGLDKTCGIRADESCCATNLALAAKFNRSNDPEFPAQVSDVRLDRYEVTAGRFRKFVAAWVAGYRPKQGDGKHEHLNGGEGLNLVGGGYESGWETDWAKDIAATAAEWDSKLACSPFATWTAGKDYLPINCVSWWESLAFCIWDGGYLPTEAEWENAALGGAAQRAYPWGNDAPVKPPAGTNPTLAAYDCLYNGNGNPSLGCTVVDFIARPGVMDQGKGFYFHSDLAGNVGEWALDYKHPYQRDCVDCVNRTFGTQTISRGGGAAGPDYLMANSFRGGLDNTDRWDGHGVRCARHP